MSALPFVVTGLAVASLLASWFVPLWMAGAKEEDSTFIDKP
jgi:hypothetical protein